MARELTREEKRAIHKLVKSLCANYDKDYGCLPLDCPCYMLGKCWTGALCRCFREAVLPADPALEAALLSDGPAPETRPCPVCGRAFLPDGRTRYCSEACAGAARRKKQRDYMRKYRGGDVLTFAPKKAACIKAFRGRFGKGQYLFPSAPVLRK